MYFLEFIGEFKKISSKLYKFEFNNNIEDTCEPLFILFIYLIKK
jgi:hypothetical protein